MVKKKITKKSWMIFLFILIIKLAKSSVIGAEEHKDVQDIRERLIKIEATMVTKDELELKIKNLRVELKADINDIRTEIKDVRTELKSDINSLRDLITWGFGLLFMSMIGLVGFVLWDRRSALTPAIRKNKELEEREEKLERVLKEAAQKDSNIQEALKHAGLL